jgi:hypothetical protein
MNPLTITAILSAISQAVSLGQAVIPELVSAGEAAIAWIKDPNAITASQQAALDADQVAAHIALQNAQPAL